MNSILSLIARRALTAASVVSLTLGPGIERSLAQDGAIAVVVHPSNTEQKMTSAEVCDTLLGERQRWPDGSLIQVFVPPAGSQEWAAVLRAVCRMNEAGFVRKVGSSRAFGHASRPPQHVTTAAEMKERVAGSRRALGFLAASHLDDTVKPLSIDGKSTKDADYPIRMSPKDPRR